MTEKPDRVCVGVQMGLQHASFAQVRDAVLRFEELGVDSVFVSDHFFPVGPSSEGAQFEAWMTLASIAERTHRVEFGPLVSATAYRNPDLQADMARTIDHISAHATGVGRFIFGTGSGGQERDFRAYGYPYDGPAARAERLARDVERVRQRWAKLTPPPTRRIPLLIGGHGENTTLRTVAEHADIWHSFSDPDTFVRRLGVVRHWCAEFGRDPNEICLATGTSLAGAGTLDAASLRAYHALGVRLFVPALDGPDFDETPVRRLLAWRETLES
ncbi:LLM class F420-dependent oxidoreductase [uncultured Schumannella sp.]|uniref:LLM class F420-dependent oxidoreductase n=1 Tax=uncultured Schumannella sp. TaxID=1195956 RepID=UPI0025D70AB4|nr:LLM class F420-dependent oxidoreductase [uncultured Schumannella sp.]